MHQPTLSLLMLTPTDFAEMWNNVEHGRVRFYREKNVPMTVIHLHLNRSARLFNMIRDALSFGTREYIKDGVPYIAVDPFFNYCSGLRVHSDASVKANAGRVSLKHFLVRALAPLAVTRDIFFTPCFVAAALWKTRGQTFDACLGIGPWASLVGLVLRKIGKIRVLVYEDRDFDPGLMPDRLRKWYTGVIEQFVQKRADLVISVGHRLAALREKESGVKPTVISNGIEWPLFDSARNASGFGKAILYVGNLSSWSGVEQNIRAMPIVLKSVPSARLIVVGSGLPEYERFLRQLVAELKLESAIEFAGSQPHAQLPQFMGVASIGLANSEPVAYRQYACPLKVIEYMAGGLPVIATEGTEAADMLRHYQCGLVSKFETEQIASAIVRLLKEPQLHEQFRTNAICESRQLDWRHLLSRELSLIQCKLNKKTVTDFSTVALKNNAAAMPSGQHEYALEVKQGTL